MPVFLKISNPPSCIGLPEIRAVGIGTGQPAKLYYSAPRQMSNVGRRLHIGEKLSASSRCVPPKANRIEVLLGLADFCPPPGLPPSLSLGLVADCGKVATAGHAELATSSSSSCSDTATPESTSDVEGASSQGSEAGDEWEDTVEFGHEAGDRHQRMQQGQGPPGFFCTGSRGPVRRPPGVFF